LAAQFKAVDKSGRVVIPQPFCDKVGWITGGSPIEAWLLMGEMGRLRLLSQEEVSGDPEIASIRSQISATADETKGGVLDFEDAPLVALAVRLVDTLLSPPPPGWRLTLPKVLLDILQISRAESQVVMTMSKGYIELWTTEVWNAAVSTPLDQIVHET
jgi:hypothetical protein